MSLSCGIDSLMGKYIPSKSLLLKFYENMNFKLQKQNLYLYAFFFSKYKDTHFKHAVSHFYLDILLSI